MNISNIESARLQFAVNNALVCIGWGNDDEDDRKLISEVREKYQHLFMFGLMDALMTFKRSDRDSYKRLSSTFPSEVASVKSLRSLNRSSALKLIRHKT
jgi:hypothetical protein